jgi:hypothetical protein
MGIQETKNGPVPFACVSVIEGEDCKDGPVDVGAELSPGIEKALQEAHNAAIKDVSTKRMQLKVRDIIIRSRAGDQNAIALIIETRKAAERGIARAKYAFGMLANYIKSHPSSKRVSFGEEKPVIALKMQIQAPSDLHYGAAVSALTNDFPSVVVLANGPEITDTRITCIHDCCPDKESFKAGFAGDRKVTVTRSGKVGFFVRLARKIQEVRKPGSNIRLFSPSIAWELGQ